ncbi:hypothetical protein PV332_10560 [Streptomyces scabiei]|uniref:hypothetical protein n=1 Tax=Streptomyces scabiei TaxID=1930 RepID=UPI0029ACDB51|nr:hypothetical protein [Streptomyces scabiei]MDX2575922.1 hypothetical protein [Streptomyces scabiei]MDX2794029.1 hypothetical protein [Streptomyces scabiei]MDX2885605.1 hypothetical protein [Streptomyces scabiei]MDX2993442.1 hypothetical protein [Streptomyces scabiei]MDX3028444.1 hypothetical protein [Streptomyces scabiei]
MAEQCLTPDYTEGPCHCDFCDPGRLRDDRIETIYQGWGAREMAERIVDLEDEAERMKGLLRYEHERANAAIAREETAEGAAEESREEAERLRTAWRSARRRAKTAMGAWRYMRWHEDAQNKEMRAQDEFAQWLWEQVTTRRKERDRYRLAWLSARRRAADEANFGMEALALKEEELATERARQASYVAELQPLIRKRMEEVRRLRAFADEVRRILGWTHVDGNWRTLHSPALHEARHELDEAQREARPFVDRVGRRAARGEFDDVEADEVRESTHGAARLESMGADEDGEVWRLASFDV